MHMHCASVESGLGSIRKPVGVNMVLVLETKMPHSIHGKGHVIIDTQFYILYK